MKKRLLIIVIAIACSLALGAYALWRPNWPWSKSAAADPAQQTGAPEEARTKVVLTPEKFATLKLSYAEVTRRAVQSVRTVTGRVEYRSVRSVEIKAPVDLVVQQVLVKPGAIVEPGTKLATLTSPDIGMARADVEKSESELKIANQAFEWTDKITRNLNELLEYLQGRPSFEDVDKEFNGKLLGNHRQDILPAYSKFLAAEKLRIGAKEGIVRGFTSEQTAVKFASNSEMAREQYLSACEQSRFDARQARDKALQAQEYAHRVLDVNKRNFRTLLGEYSKPAVADDSSADEGTELTHFDLIAPLAGTVEQRLTADSQRVAEGTLLFIVANTDVLEVRANIFDGDWRAVSPLEPGQMLKVVVPALGEDREFDAKVDYVGRAVDPHTRAVPLMALLDNAQHEFKPGMYARIKIPSGTAEDELVIPVPAVRTHDRQEFVFVVDADDPRTFHRVDVLVDKRTPDWLTIASGLAAGQRVVVEGAIVLKNELLLEQEED